jgi:hypothetical protein
VYTVDSGLLFGHFGAKKNAPSPLTRKRQTMAKCELCGGTGRVIVPGGLSRECECEGLPHLAITRESRARRAADPEPFQAPAPPVRGTSRSGKR